MTEKTDRELLELAAKACGYLTWWVVEKQLWVREKDQEIETWWPWNPLDYDADALRLLEEMPGCSLYVSEIGATVFLPRNQGEHGLKCDEYASEHGDDLQKAIRQAIVRARIAIGESMK